MATLCDRAVVREGLLQVLGAGANTLGRDPLPAPLDVDFALMLLPETQEEAIGPHELQIRVNSIDGKLTLAEIGAGWESDPDAPAPHPFPMVPLALPLRFVAVEKYGEYEVIVALNDEELTRVPFVVRPPPAQPAP